MAETDKPPCQPQSWQRLLPCDKSRVVGNPEVDRVRRAQLLENRLRMSGEMAIPARTLRSQLPSEPRTNGQLSAHAVQRATPRPLNSDLHRELVPEVVQKSSSGKFYQIGTKKRACDR